MVRLMFIGVVATLLGFSCRADAWGGGKKKDEEPEMPTGKDAVDLGRAGFRQVESARDNLWDKNFKKEMNKLMESDEWKNGATDATDFLQDPKAMEAMAKKTKEYTDFIAAGPGKDGKRDAAMGLNAASASMMDPNFMKDAMEMMQDPAVMKQVEETMKNPEFMKQMKEVMDNPAMKEQLAKAGANMEELMKNPELMAEAQRQLQAMMGGAAAA
ncbi:expressed unknown protein [Ectocarpus siliculosus]|uniref:STI1 domain-containing protein n=1 Tax=Ectocarpus siliculosus TaxID=2880 RepID=D7FVX9_ECTSI|nr:expressed unknown protein [Ectocarpus siliculosus]|eukprot:CBJ25499.1 expressed unknown protein [Ectocarpus siliculosus]